MIEVYCLRTNDYYQYIKSRNKDLDKIKEKAEDCNSIKEVIEEINEEEFFILLYEKSPYGRHKKLKTGNAIFSYSSYFLVLSPKAIDCLRDLLEPNGEIYRVESYHDSKEYYIFNCLNVIDAFEDKFEDGEDASSELIGIRKGFPIEENVKNQIIFKDKNIFKSHSPIYVTKKFIDRVLENKLKGFTFYHIWQGTVENRLPAIDS